MPTTSYSYVPKSREITADTISWETLEEFLKNRSYRRVLYLVGGASVVLAAWYLYRKFSARNKRMVGASTSSTRVDDAETSRADESRNNNTKVAPTGPPVEDKVIIHCCPRGFFVPSIATEPLKLETFLRVAKIPYEVNFCSEFETPFLTYGEKTGNDFRECVRILSEKFDVNLEGKDVTASRKTASHLVDISLENMFSWAILIWRWIYDEGKSMKKIHAMNALGEEVVPEVAQRVKDATKFQPIGQLDKAEFVKTINQGIHDISAALGKHKYFQGQTPGIVDCHAFAILAQMMWNMPGSPFESQLKKFGNLVEFVQRMKEKYWPDWNELILKPKEFEEAYNAFTAVKHRRSSSNGSKSRKSSKVREQEESCEDKSAMEQIAGNEEEGGLEKTLLRETKVALTSAGNKFPEPEPVTPITKKDNPLIEHKQEPTSATPPVGILKAGATANNTNVVKPRSGFVSASVGSTKFPVEQVTQPSTPKLEIEKDYNPPPQQPFSTKQDDSMLHVHKTSVKFANVESEESTMIDQQPQHQNSANINNGNYQTSNTSSNASSRVGHHYHVSASEELSKKSIDRQQPANQHHKIFVHQDQYTDYQQRQSMQSPNSAPDSEFHRAQAANAFYQTNVPSAYTQSSYPIPPQMFNSQQIPTGVPPNYSQQMHYATSQASSPIDEALQLPPPFSHHHALNPEQLQKAAQAHLDAYYHQRQQYQQQQQQQVAYNNNYHTPAGHIPSYVAPNFDPRNPQALLRF